MKRVSLTAVLLLGLLAAGCDQQKDEADTGVVLEGKTMGTQWRVSLPGVTAAQAAALREKIQQRLDNDDQELDRKRFAVVALQSDRTTQPQPISSNMADIITVALRIGRLTDGAMDITVGPLVNLWGFGPDQQPPHTPSLADIAAAKALTGLRHLQVIERADGARLQKDLPWLYVDLSTMGEGFATDHLARLMEEEDHRLSGVGGRRGADARRQRRRQSPAGGDSETHRPENAAQALVDLQGTASAPPAAIATIMNWTADAFRM